MWLVFGLGNPEEDYEGTRHNVGFAIINTLAARFSIALKRRTHSFNYGRGFIEETDVILIKPFIFMNRSGRAVREALTKYGDAIDDLLIVHDDLDLEPGVIRIRKAGSSGGHNGIQSIIESLGSQDFNRLKFGIGRPEREPAERYVLRRFNKQERPAIEEAIETAADAVATILAKGVSAAQNQFHSA